MERANVVNYEIYVYQSYHELLYRTSITGECDVALAMLTVSAPRVRCENDTASKTMVHGCNTGCCANFGTPFTSDTIGAILAKPEFPHVFTALLSPQVVNILSLCIIAIVVCAHLIWIFERHKNSEQFPTVSFF